VFFEVGRTEIVVYGVFMALETREGGDTGETHNKPLERTGFAGRSAPGR